MRRRQAPRSGTAADPTTTSHVSAPAISTIPTFSQPAGVTAASSTPSVTQLSAESSAAGRLARRARGGRTTRARTGARRRARRAGSTRARPAQRDRGQRRNRDQRKVGQPGRRVRDVADREHDEHDRGDRDQRPRRAVEALELRDLRCRARRGDDAGLQRQQPGIGWQERKRHAPETTVGAREPNKNLRRPSGDGRRGLFAGPSSGFAHPGYKPNRHSSSRSWARSSAGSFSPNSA